MKKSLVLLILDGWGIGKKDTTNPLYTQKLPTFDYIKNNFPGGALQASGISIGLPWEERGNSEIGHLTIGSGKITYQNFPRISLAIKNGDFFKNEQLNSAFSESSKNDSTIHFVGLVSKSNNDSSLEHLRSLIKMAEEKKSLFALHLITDGKDSPKKSALEIIKEFPEKKISSLSGRYYAMDEDEHWDRIEKVYKAITGTGSKSESVSALLENNYQRNLSDEYLEPSLISKGPGPIKENDSVIFFNFREDSSWQLASSFTDPNFQEFPKTSISNLFAVSLTDYGPGLSIKIAFPQEITTHPLSKIVSDAGKTQIKIGETIKYYSLTYFFNGLNEKPFKNEYRVLIPSNNNPHQDEFPAMRALEITSRAIQSINERVFDLIIINYANFDVIGHTGNLKAASKTALILDKEINKIIRASSASGMPVLILGSHGNVEQMVNPQTGMAETINTKNPVPFYLIEASLQFSKSSQRLMEEESSTIGILSDIAPTVLDILEIPPSSEMSGQSLLKYLTK